MILNKSNDTILIVDDRPENVSILASYLSDYKIKVALDGTKALGIIESGVYPTVILLDVDMPDMDGYEVCQRIKASDVTKNIPIIFISGMSELQSKVKGFRCGAVDYITKPFQLEEVKSRVNVQIELANYRDKLENMNIILEQKIEERTHELMIAKEKAEEVSRLKSHFLALINHEIRTPMMGIMGFSDILIEEVKDGLLSGFARNLKESAVRLKETLESILNISLQESDTKMIIRDNINISNRVKELLITHTQQAKKKGLNISVKNTLSNDVVFIDKTMFDIIFNNIVGNAIKYTETGWITIEYSDYYEKNSLILCLKVSDTGIGIPISKHKIIFEEFRQADEGMERSYEGVGLGLTLVKKYVDLQNGEVILDSDIGKGTMLTVKLPVQSMG